MTRLLSTLVVSAMLGVYAFIVMTAVSEHEADPETGILRSADAPLGCIGLNCSPVNWSSVGRCGGPGAEQVLATCPGEQAAMSTLPRGN